MANFAWMNRALRRSELAHVRQQTLKDCVVATAAMIANVDYEDARSMVHVSITRRGLGAEETRKLLENLTRVKWRSRYGWLRRLEDITLHPREPLMVWIRKPWHWQTLHAVAIFRDWVHDPSFGEGIPRNEYPSRHWRVVRVWQPKDVNTFAAVRLKNWADRNIEIVFPE
jgi:hypothetical protein